MLQKRSFEQERQLTKIGMVQGPAAGLDALDAAATLAGDSAPAATISFPAFAWR